MGRNVDRITRSSATRSIAHLRGYLKRTPTTVAAEVAREVAPIISGRTRASFGDGRTVYDDPRPTSVVNGEPLTLRETGTVRDQLGFTADGTQMRAVLGPDYAGYLVGKYEILPNKQIPPRWQPLIRERVDAAFQNFAARVKVERGK